MKKVLIVLALFTAIVGCGDSAEKAADKINDAGNEANVLADRGAKTYLQAYNSGSPEKMSLSELETTRATYMAARSDLLASKNKYQKALDLAKENKDTVKTHGKDSVYDAMSKIDIIVKDIDQRVERIDVLVKRKLRAQRDAS